MSANSSGLPASENSFVSSSSFLINSALYSSGVATLFS
jgi:hypothetical protein